MDNTEQGSIASRYQSLSSSRETFLERARESSELTLPFLVPPSGHSDATRYPTPYQGIGARGVNNLASKLLLALVPPNAPFFRLQINDFVLKDMEQDKPLKTDVEKALGEVERAVMSEVEMSADRVQIFEALKHLIVSGNCLLVVEDEGTRLFPLERFVIKRDPMGQVLEIITKESLSPKSLPEDVAEIIQADLSGDEKSVDIYTHFCKRDKHFDVMQEVKPQHLIKCDNGLNERIINFAKKHSIPCIIVNTRFRFFESIILSNLNKYRINIICLAGYMKIISKNFLRSFKKQVVNIHPSLLPKFKGLNTYKRILKTKEIKTGCTVHFVNEKLDGGRIIAQKSFYIMLNSNLSDLKKRTQNLEYSAYPEALIKIFRSSY